MLNERLIQNCSNRLTLMPGVYQMPEFIRDGNPWIDHDTHGHHSRETLGVRIHWPPQVATILVAETTLGSMRGPTKLEIPRSLSPDEVPNLFLLRDGHIGP